MHPIRARVWAVAVPPDDTHTHRFDETQWRVGPIERGKHGRELRPARVSCHLRPFSASVSRTAISVQVTVSDWAG
jgi:hypothetical protein